MNYKLLFPQNQVTVTTKNFEFDKYAQYSKTTTVILENLLNNGALPNLKNNLTKYLQILQAN